ncbi:MAG TPA: sialidase family protein, partial [Actinomycetes bacterium]|nr:sialidase family protein [Actinomycetes bacterium]
RRRRRRFTAAITAAAAVVVLVVGLSAVIRVVTPPAQTVAPPPDSGTAATSAPDSPTAATSAPSPRSAPATGHASDLPAGAAVPAGAAPRSVTTAANGLVYVLAAAPCPGGQCPALLRTTDDGRSWRALPAPDGARVNDVRFANPRDGWLYGAQLWATHDGAAEAATWRRIDLGAEVSVLDLASDGTTVWAFVADCTAGDDLGCIRGRLLAASVGSDEFAPVPGATLPGPIFRAQLQIAGSRGTLLVTDGAGPGKTFVRRPGDWTRLPRSGPCAQTPVAVVPPATGPAGGLVALCAADAGAGSVTYVTYRSLDEGTSWTRVGPGLRVSNADSTVAAASLDRLAVAVGTPDLQGGLWVSQDGGATWSQPASLPTSQTGWVWVGAAGGARYLAVPFDPTGSVWVSDSAGRSWTPWALR